MRSSDLSGFHVADLSAACLTSLRDPLLELVFSNLFDAVLKLLPGLLIALFFGEQEVSVELQGR